MVEDPDLICHQLYFGKQVGGDEHSTVKLPGQGLYEGADLVDAGRVEAVGGLIQDQDGRASYERPGKPEPLLHAERIFFRRSVPELGQPDKLQRVPDAAPGKPQDPADDIQVFFPGQAAVKGGRFDKRTDFLQDGYPVGRIGLSVDLKAPSRGAGKPEEHFHGRGFPRAVRPEETVYASLADVQV